MTKQQTIPHEYVPSRVGHGETQCKWCLGTNRELAIISPNHCNLRADRDPAWTNGDMVDRQAAINAVSDAIAWNKDPIVALAALSSKDKG